MYEYILIIHVFVFQLIYQVCNIVFYFVFNLYNLIYVLCLHSISVIHFFNGFNLKYLFCK